MPDDQHSGWVHVAALADFGDARKLVREVQGISILLIRLGADVVAVDNRCTHLDQPLERGRVMSGQITCPFHGACFDLRSGAAVSGPAVTPLRCHPVRLDGDNILLNPDHGTSNPCLIKTNNWP